MLRQNPNNPCELQQFNETSNQWETIFTVSLCKDSGEAIPTSLGKQCNIASFLVDILLPDAAEKILNARENSEFSWNFVAIVMGLAAGIPGLGTAEVIVLMTVAGGAAFGSLFHSIDVGAARLELDNQYWLDLKQ